MATVARSTKVPPAKKSQESGQSPANPQRHTPAWGNVNRNSISPIPPFSPNPNNTRATNGFPPLHHTNGRAGVLSEEKEKLLNSVASSIGAKIVVTLRSTNIQYEGILNQIITTPAEEAGLHLKDAKDLSTPGASLKDSLTIHAANIATVEADITSDNTNKNASNSFRTDTEISGVSQQKRERELQAWKPEGPDSSTNPTVTVHRGDELTFGPDAGGSWDQFATNERLFGVTTKFDEELYTTKIDRTAKDYKERERRAEKIAAEIIGSVTANPHIAEERNLRVDDSGVNEEDKFGAVVRGANAYVPPGARRANSNTAVTTKEKAEEKLDISSVSVNIPDGSDKSAPEKPVTSPSTASSGTVNAKPPADAFRDFVTNERQRLTQKKQAIVKSEMDKRMAELLNFSQNFKLNKPIPEDLVSILAKDEKKQRQIREKSQEDAASAHARAIATSISHATQTPGKTVVSAVAKAGENARKSTAAAPNTKPGVTSSKSSGAVSSASNGSSVSPANSNGKLGASNTTPRLSMVIQSIPPFKGAKAKQPIPTESKPAGSSTTQPLSPTSAQRLNVNATSFRPNPKAVAFTPNGASSTGTSPSTTTSPKAKTDGTTTATTHPNPFFGTQHIKKTPVNVKDDFNPFKQTTLGEASGIAALWPYTGKRYAQSFPTIVPPPQASPHITSHAPAPPPPPPYDEATEAAARGYAVYTYAPYPYPGQPMMASMGGMPPTFVPSPYMPHMPYPPSMPPPNGQPMYAPAPMGQMHPPHQPYMPPPAPPGAFPPPPNSAGPRPSMPPTPIPSHAHPYYQSPQMQHAVPYQMMMPPPGPNGPPHPYENAPPPVPMGGHA